MSGNTILRILLAIWVVGYLAISCGPFLSQLDDGIGATLVAGLFGLVLGSALFVPWIVGVVILVGLVVLTNPRRPRY
jgi:hypothetical protein